ncbi:hypothetical protein GCM10025781_20010 [Kocuria gwangalliensis]|uniref:Uncharacterized protein n=1 Tax=Kocuria gwangalliensis TaxID=501592 RepID=A0ABP8XA30_9MICC
MIGEFQVVEFLGPLGLPVIRQVHQQAAEFRLQPLGDHAEILAPAEEAMEKHDAMIAVSGFDGMNGGWVRVSHTPNLLVTPPHRPRPSQRKGSGPGTAQSVDVLRSLRLGQVGG